MRGSPGLQGWCSIYYPGVAIDRPIHYPDVSWCMRRWRSPRGIYGLGSTFVITRPVTSQFDILVGRESGLLGRMRAQHVTSGPNDCHKMLVTSNINDM